MLFLLLAGPLAALETSLESPDAGDDLLETLQAASLSYTATQRGFDTPQEILAAAQSDYRTLVAVLYDAGHYSGVVRIRVDGREAADIPPFEIPSAINRIAITVETGRVFRFGRAEIGPVAAETDLPDGYRSGEPAPSGMLEATTLAAITGWRDAGHAKANVGKQSLIANHRDAILNAVITMEPGPKLSFGRATISGNERARTEAIERIAGFPAGETFSPEKARKTASRLRRTGTFSSVSVREAKVANPDDTLDFDISVVEAPLRRIEVGAEISSRQGLDLSFKWTHRNMFGGAERLQFETRLRNIGGESDLDGLLSLRLDRPAFFGPDNDLFYLLELEQLSEEHYDLFRSAIGVGWRRIYSDELFAEVAIAANYNVSDDVFGNDRKFKLISLPSRIQWDKRDDPINATQGFYLNLDATPFVGFQNTESGLYGLLDGRGYIGFGANNNVVLAGRLQLGTVLGASIQNISPDLLFYSGGAGTVRGQPYQSLGIPVGAGTAGGRSFLGLSGEVRTRVTEKLSLVGFFDFGAVDQGQFVSESSPSHSGAGLGVRYNVAGIGALRLDLAYPVDGTTSDGLQFYFGIGQAF